MAPKDVLIKLQQNDFRAPFCGETGVRCPSDIYAQCTRRAKSKQLLRRTWDNKDLEDQGNARREYERLWATKCDLEKKTGRNLIK
jgi:hypothetical protein